MHQPSTSNEPPTTNDRSLNKSVLHRSVEEVVIQTIGVDTRTEIMPSNLQVKSSFSFFPKFITGSPQELKSNELNNSRKSITDNVNHLIFLTIDNPLSSYENLKNLINFVIFKIMIPLFTFTILAVLLIEAHILIDDYCFHPEICQCKDFATFVYTIFKQILHTHAAIMILLYFCISFITHDFYKKGGWKISYLIFSLLCFFGYFLGNYQNTGEDIENALIINLVMILFGSGMFFSLVLGFLNKGLSKEYFKRLFLVVILLFVLFFHRFYFKNNILFLVLERFKECFDTTLSLNLFKVFLTLYYMSYGFLSNKLLFYFYKRIKNDKLLSYNIIIFALKFVCVDVYSIKALNALSIPLNQTYSWGFFIFYFYSVFSTYVRKNFVTELLMKLYHTVCISTVSKKKRKSPKNKKNAELSESEKYQNLRSGCIFETNLIIFLRILSYRIFGSFYSFTDKDFLYRDCSLRENINSFVLFDVNIILMMSIHTLLLVFLGIVVYGLKWQRYLFDYRVEDINIVGRLFLFMTCFAYADYSLQMYKAFKEIV